MVHDVVIDGVSLVDNYRAQFQTVIQRSSYAGLVREMRARITDLGRPILYVGETQLLTTGGLHDRNDAPFRALEEPLGDPGFRVIPHLHPKEALALDAPYVEQKFAPKDPEVALPMAALQALHEAGVVGPPGRRHFSFCGGVVRPYPGIAESCETIAGMLREDGAVAAVLLPTCSICVQTVCIAARELEARGFPTVTISLIPELTRIVGAPRTLAARFPFGAPCGDPGNASLHRAVLREAMELLVSLDGPGEIRASAHSWRGTEEEERGRG